MKSLIPAVSLLSLLAFAGVSACNGAGGTNSPSTIAVKSEELKAGGVYIAYMNGKCSGCEQLEKGDLILQFDGAAVTTAKDLRTSRIADGAPHKLKVHKKSGQLAEVTITATPQELPPLKDIPPFWSVGAADLDKAPVWARRTLFAHASPMTMLVAADGGTTDGRQMFGKKRLIMFWDYATREEQAQAVNMMKILQLAQDDLKASGIEIMFTQIRFPGNDNGDGTPRQAPMNDTALRQFQADNGEAGKATLPMFRFPNATEYNAAREVGLEGATTYIQYLRASPALILLDEGGIVRWHSEGITSAPAGDTTYAGKDDQYTVVQAIEFAKKM